MQNHKLRLGPIETSNSDANHVVLHAQDDRWVLGPMETSNSGLFFMQKSTGEVWDP